MLVKISQTDQKTANYSTKSIELIHGGQSFLIYTNDAGELTVALTNLGEKIVVTPQATNVIQIKGEK